MTDISESGIEAAVKAHNTRQDPTLYGMTVQDYGLQQHAREVVQMTAAIQAYLPFHPPASREEGLREALKTLVAAVDGMRVPQNTFEAGVQVMLTVGPALTNARAALRSKKPE